MRRYLRFYTITIFAAIFVVNTLISRELLINKPYSEVIPMYPSKDYVIKSHTDKFQALEYYILDSLANLFSFFNERTMPFSYSRETGTLIILKRGYYDSPGYTGVNTKNNLFLLLSEDWGKTWKKPILVFDSKKYPTMGGARYPSVYGFTYDDELIVTFISPGVDEASSQWRGFICGFWAQSFGEIAIQMRNAPKDLIAYSFGTDSKLLGGVSKNNDPFGIAITPVSSPNDPTDNNNIVCLKSTPGLDSWPPIFPPQWSSSKFVAVDDIRFRNNSIVGLHYGPEGKMYMTVHGRFTASENPSKITSGFSVSTDQGANWSEFNIFPISVLNQYLATINVHPDSCFLNWDSKSSVVFEDGSVSIIVQLDEFDRSKFTADRARLVLELYYENGSWGVRKVGDKNLFMVYRDVLDNNNNPVNQIDIELQAARTVDGNGLIAKWVVLNDIDWDQGTFRTSDIIVAARAKSANSWKQFRITDSDQIIRCTWIPDFIPNNYSNIPLIRLVSKPDEDDNADSLRAKIGLATVPQYLLFTHFSLEYTGVEEKDVEKNELFGVYPNPATDESTINFYLGESSHVRIEIYDLLGNRVMNLYDNVLGSGFRAVPFKVNQFSPGMYLCVLNINGNVLTKKFNVIK